MGGNAICTGSIRNRVELFCIGAKLVRKTLVAAAAAAVKAFRQKELLLSAQECLSFFEEFTSK